MKISIIAQEYNSIFSFHLQSLQQKAKWFGKPNENTYYYHLLGIELEFQMKNSTNIWDRYFKSNCILLRNVVVTASNLLLLPPHVRTEPWAWLTEPISGLIDDQKRRSITKIENY